MFIYLAILVVFLIFLHLAFNYNEKARLIRKIPGPKDSFIIGNAREIMVTSPGSKIMTPRSRNRLLQLVSRSHTFIPCMPTRNKVALMKLGRDYSARWPGIYRFWSFPFGVVNIFNPNDIEVMMSSTKYNDKSLMYQFLQPWLRDGLLISNGEKWQRRRKLLTPAFHFNILRKFFVILEENTQRMVKALATTDGEKINVVPMLSEYTLHSICETAMGTHLNDNNTTGASRSYKQAIHALGQLFVYRFLRVHMYSNLIFNASSVGRTMKHYLSTVHGFTRRVIRDRREYVNKYGIKTDDIEENGDEVVYKQRKRTAMLDLLLSAEKDGLIDEIGIQEEVDTFMFEGHDTTASGLNFCLVELANNKDIQAKICDELKVIYGDSTRQATPEDLTKMRYLELCIKESLRLYPPVHFIGRKIDEPVTLSGYSVPAGTLCHINILDLHRNPELYEDPLLFNPERFLPENSVGRHPYAYIPFSAGPRNCIGQKFAMMEIKLAISEILRNFKLEPVTRREDIEFTADLVLRNSKPLYVSFVRK